MNPKVLVMLDRQEIQDLQAALYENFDFSWTPNLQRAEVLHEKLEKARDVIALKREAGAIQAELLA